MLGKLIFRRTIFLQKYPDAAKLIWKDNSRSRDFGVVPMTLKADCFPGVFAQQSYMALTSDLLKCKKNAVMLSCSHHPSLHSLPSTNVPLSISIALSCCEVVTLDAVFTGTNNEPQRH